MRHVTRLYGSRLRTRTLSHQDSTRSVSSFVPFGREEDCRSTKLPTRTLRPRSHGNRALPISALFDPVSVAARTKHEEPKPLPSRDPAELTDFQRELAQNVHAQALSTPVRTCVLTKARLPSHFLIPFVPQFPPKEPSTTSESPQKDPLQPQHTSPSLIPRIGVGANKTSQPSSYVLASHAAISHLSGQRLRKKSRGGGKWALLVNERMKRAWSAREGKSMDKFAAAKEWEWDEEMVERVRGLLGKEVIRRLRWCVKQDEGLVGRTGHGELVRVGGGDEMVGGYDLRGMMDEETLVEMRGLVGGEDEFTLRKHPKTGIARLALEALKNFVEGYEKIRA